MIFIVLSWKLEYQFKDYPHRTFIVPYFIDIYYPLILTSIILSSYKTYKGRKNDLPGNLDILRPFIFKSYSQKIKICFFNPQTYCGTIFGIVHLDIRENYHMSLNYPLNPSEMGESKLDKKIEGHM